MKTLTRSSVINRENFLKKVYNENSSSAFNLKKAKKKERASRLIDELRKRYGFNTIMKPVDLGIVSHESITGNGKYSLD